jgi:hypothetical protein
MIPGRAVVIDNAQEVSGAPENEDTSLMIVAPRFDIRVGIRQG